MNQAAEQKTVTILLRGTNLMGMLSSDVVAVQCSLRELVSEEKSSGPAVWEDAAKLNFPSFSVKNRYTTKNIYIN